MWTKFVTPRFGDIDGLRHINNCMLPIWFETAREPFFRLFHPNLDLDDEWQLIMAKITVEFMSQMRLGADVEIRTFIKKIGRSSMTLYQEAWQGGVLGAKGEAVVVHYDFREKKSLPIPEAIRIELERHPINESGQSGKSGSVRFSAGK
jgi:acyl-CoA thioester hydrolase